MGSESDSASPLSCAVGPRWESSRYGTDFAPSWSLDPNADSESLSAGDGGCGGGERGFVFLAETLSLLAFFNVLPFRVLLLGASLRFMPAIVG